MKGIAWLQGTVKHYDWGGYHFIPALLGQENRGNKPFAEYWLGTHPQADCRVVQADGAGISFTRLVEAEASRVLGPAVAGKWGTLPYLLKVLDVRDMLSIQVHPLKAHAQEGFEEENRAGVPIDASHRNYKDRNHKPELMVAMGEFWLLHGFRPEASLKKILAATPELKGLLPVFEEKGYRALYKMVMEMPQHEVNKWLQSLLNRILPLYNEGRLNRSSPDFWAARAALTFAVPGGLDRGIFSVYLFNLVKLQSGEAIFQDAGVPHAYLEGRNVEIMASSDNVLRGGLTTKHVDVPELLKHVRAEATEVNILRPGQPGKQETAYITPAPDFALSSFSLKAGEKADLVTSSAEILLLMQGQVLATVAGDTLRLGRPSVAALVTAGEKVVLLAEEDTLVFRARVPQP